MPAATEAHASARNECRQIQSHQSSRERTPTKCGWRHSEFSAKCGCQVLWLTESAIQRYLRDAFSAVPQVVRSPFEANIREHLARRDARGSEEQAPQMPGAQVNQLRDAAQRHVASDIRFHEFYHPG